MAIRARTRKDGKTVYDIRVQYGNLRVSRTVPTTMTEAKRVESKLLQDLIQGKYEILKTRQNPRFRDYAEEYKKIVTWQKSYKRTTQHIDHLVKYFGRMRLTEISTQEFLNYRAERLHSVSLATVNREHSCLLRMLNVAIKDDRYQINKNPLNGIKKFKEPPAEDRVLEEEEYHKLLEAAPEYFRKILFFACNTGMRHDEILNLKFGQIKFWLDNAEVELLDTKSGDKEYVPLNTDVIELIYEIAEEKKIDLKNISERDKQKYVFTGMRGQRLQSVRKPMAKTFKNAGIKPRPFHTFRHFWTKMMFEAGVDPATIQKVGRWRDFNTMLRYCYTTRPQEHEAVNKLSKRLTKKETKILRMRQYSGKNAK
jgi:integrase